MACSVFAVGPLTPARLASSGKPLLSTVCPQQQPFRGASLCCLRYLRQHGRSAPPPVAVSLRIAPLCAKLQGSRAWPPGRGVCLPPLRARPGSFIRNPLLRQGVRVAAAASGKGRPPSGLASRAKCRGVQSAVARGQGTAASIAQAASLPFGFGLAPCAFCRSASRPRQPAPPRPFCSALRSASGGRLGGLRAALFLACLPPFVLFFWGCGALGWLFSPLSLPALFPRWGKRGRGACSWACGPPRPAAAAPPGFFVKPCTFSL